MTQPVKILFEFFLAVAVFFSPFGDIPIKAAIKLGGVYFPDMCLRSVVDSNYKPELPAPCAPWDAGFANVVVYMLGIALIIFVIYINRDEIKELLG